MHKRPDMKVSETVLQTRLVYTEYKQYYGIHAEVYWRAHSSFKYLNYTFLIIMMKRKLDKVGGLRGK